MALKKTHRYEQGLIAIQMTFHTVKSVFFPALIKEDHAVFSYENTKSK